MTLDDIEREFWGDQREQPVRVRLARVVKALRPKLELWFFAIDQAVSEKSAQAFADGFIAEIIGEEQATAGAIQPQGEENGFRTGIGGPEGGQEGGPRGMEREGDVPVFGEWLDLYREPPTTFGDLPRGDSDRLPPSHRHEDGGQQVRSVAGVTDRRAGGGLERGHGVSRDEAAGTAPLGNESRIRYPAPAADHPSYTEYLNETMPMKLAPAAEVCTWSHPKPGPIGQLVEYERSTCGNPKWAEGYPKWVDGYFESKCQCGRPIYVDQQDPANAWLMESRA